MNHIQMILNNGHTDNSLELLNLLHVLWNNGYKILKKKGLIDITSHTYGEIS